jgi:hypothetical protein
MTTWCLSLPGDPAWWQAFAGIVQAGLALAIFYVTRRYVNLTAQLVRLQGDIVNLEKQGKIRELYDRCVKVYDAVMNFLSEFARDLRADPPSIRHLNRDTREAEFLFEAEIPGLIETIRMKASQHYGLRPDNAASKDLGQIEELEHWLTSQAFTEAKEKFGRYLKLAESADASPTQNG